MSQGKRGLKQRTGPRWTWGISWIPSDGAGAHSGGQNRNGLELPVSFEGKKTVAGQVPVPSLLTFKTRYTQAPMFNSSTPWLRCLLPQPTPINSSKPGIQCPLPWEALSVSPGKTRAILKSPIVSLNIREGGVCIHLWPPAAMEYFRAPFSLSFPCCVLAPRTRSGMQQLLNECLLSG